MTRSAVIRWKWLKGMYIYTIAVAGLFGLAILVALSAVKSALGMSASDPVIFGVVGSVYVAFGLLSVLGLRAPLRFAPVLLLQLAYKAIWFVALALPLALRGQFPAHGLVFVAIFVTFIVGDLVAIPFGELLKRERAN